MNEQWAYTQMLWIWERCAQLKRLGYTYAVGKDRTVYIYCQNDPNEYPIGTVMGITNYSQDIAQQARNFEERTLQIIQRERNRERMNMLEEGKKAAREAGEKFATWLLWLAGPRGAEIPLDIATGELAVRAKLLGYADPDQFIEMLAGFNAILMNYRLANEKKQLTRPAAAAPTDHPEWLQQM